MLGRVRDADTWCHARYPSRTAWLGAIGCLALGLLAKPTLVPLPFALLLLDFWPLARRESFARLLLEKLPRRISGWRYALTSRAAS
jgi:hypothetical protein